MMNLFSNTYDKITNIMDNPAISMSVDKTPKKLLKVIFFYHFDLVDLLSSKSSI